MIKPSSIALWLRCWCAALLLSCTVVATAPLHAQEPTSGARAAGNNPAVATDGATLIHGNYCGAGNRPGKPPIDALDLACMNHDACTPTGGIPTCDCNERLRDEAAAVARDPRQAPELQSLASLTSAAAAVMLCKPAILNAAAPPTPVRPAAVIPPPAAQAPVTAASTEPAVAPVAAPPVAAAPMDIAPVAVAPTPEAPATGTPVSDAPASSVPVPLAPVSRAPSSP